MSTLPHPSARGRLGAAPVAGDDQGMGLVVLGAIWASLISASVVQDLVVPSGMKIWLLDVDAERSVYTWFSQLLLAGAAALLYLTGRNLAALKQGLAWQWFALAALFALLSLDEAISLHERASSVVSAIVPTSGYLYFAWVVPAAIFCSIGLTAAWPFIKSFPPQARVLLVGSAGVFLTGAIGMEMVGSKIFDQGAGQTSMTYRLAANLEEGLEGLGVLLFLVAIHLYRKGLPAR